MPSSPATLGLMWAVEAVAEGEVGAITSSLPLEGVVRPISEVEGGGGRCGSRKSAALFC